MSISPKIKYPYRWVDPQSQYPDNRDIFVVLKVYSEEHYTQILSAGTEGAYLMYPDDHHFVSVPLMEADIMSCEQIAECLLNSQYFKDSFIDYLLTNPTFLTGISNRITDINEIDANRQLSDNLAVKELKTESNDKDVIWGGCREVVEYWLDTLKTLCFFLEGVSDVVDIVTKIYNADKKKRVKFNDAEIDGSPVQLSADGELVNPAGEWEFVPNILGQLVQTISESTMIGFIGDILGLGASLILADITDTRAEALSCILFNQITCDGENPKNPPYIFDNPTIYNAGNAMVGNIDAGLAGNAIGLCLTIVGVANSFISLIPLDETHRNFRIGTRSPSDEWVEICENCEEPPPTWVQEFDFKVSDHAAFWTNVPSIAPPFSLPELTTWVAGSGWGNGRIYDNARQREQAYILGFWDARVITRIDIEYKLVAGNGGSFQFNNVVFDRKSGTTYPNVFVIAPSGTIAGDYAKSQSIANISMDGCRIQVTGYQRAGNNNPNGATFISKVTIYGNGDNPFS